MSEESSLRSKGNEGICAEVKKLRETANSLNEKDNEK